MPLDPHRVEHAQRLRADKAGKDREFETLHIELHHHAAGAARAWRRGERRQASANLHEWRQPRITRELTISEQPMDRVDHPAEIERTHGHRERLGIPHAP